MELELSTKAWLAGASLLEQGQRLFTWEELVGEVLRLFRVKDREPLTHNQNEYVDPNMSDERYFVAEGDQFRLTAAADTVRWNQGRWPLRSEVSAYYQPLWDLVMPLLGAEVPVVTPSPVAAALVDEDLPDLEIQSSQSSYREAMLEHLLIGELMRHLWPKRLLEVCKPQVDQAGYDLILQCDGVLRHVQRKTSKLTAKSAAVDLQVALWERPGACVIWTRFDPETLALQEFWWLGSPAQPLPALDSLVLAKHTKGNAKGVKAQRPALRKVPKGRFKRLLSVADLVKHLFDTQPNQ